MNKFTFPPDCVLLAPMAGVTAASFRSLCLEQGADFGCTEMISAEGLSYGNAKTENLLHLAQNESKVAVQLFGHRAASLAAQARRLEKQMGDKIIYFDINMGCPARKIVKKGDGAALMKNPTLATEIVKAVSSAVTLPVTVKFRRGYRVGEDTSHEFAQLMEEVGASAVTVHGRFAEQYYQGTADWDCIARIKQTLSIPVVGNGDVVDGESARMMRAHTNCDAIMIGRAAQGNPWVFAQAKAVLQGKPVPAKPSIQQRLAMAKRHAALIDADPYSNNLLSMRRHAMSYVMGMPGASKARGFINACATVEEFCRVFDMLGEMHEEHERNSAFSVVSKKE